MPKRMIAIAALAATLACGADDTPQTAADLVVTGGRVWTGNPEAPWAEAVAAQGDRIVALGTTDAIERWVGADTQVIEAGGGLVTPGFIDTHVHFMTGGLGLASVQLRDAATPDEFTRRLGDFAATLEPGAWIHNGNWDHENWGGQLPHRDWIDAVTPDNPVAVRRLDGHMLLANSAALAAAGIDASTADIPGGEIVRDPDGEPTGVLKDNAMALVLGAAPPPSAAQQDAAIAAAAQHLLAQGVTSVHDMTDWSDLAAYERNFAAAAPGVRIRVCVQLPGWERLRDRVATQGHGDEWLSTGCLKAMVDGSLGSHTAAFHEPFTDAPDDRGLLIHEPDQLREWVAAADAAGLQVNVHAIGDRAIDMILDTFDEVASTNGPRDRRFRVEHAQHPSAAAIERFASLGVIASMQPYHAIDDGRWAEKVIGPERALTTYAFRSFLDAGAILAFGSDWFVAPPTPIEGIYAAVTRRTLDGANPDGWVPAQKITVEEALHAYTVAGAYAGFDETLKGSLEPGKFADIVVLDRDLTAIDPAEIRDASVVATIVGGRVEYRAE